MGALGVASARPRDRLGTMPARVGEGVTRVLRAQACDGSEGVEAGSECVGDERRCVLLQNQPRGTGLHQAYQASKPDQAWPRDIRDVCGAERDRQMMRTYKVHIDVAQQHRVVGMRQLTAAQSGTGVGALRRRNVLAPQASGGAGLALRGCAADRSQQARVAILSQLFPGAHRHDVG